MLDNDNIFSLFQVIFFTVNELIGRSVYSAYDVGDTIFLHLFAGLFGLAISKAVSSNKDTDYLPVATTKSSNSFSLLGTLLLWVFWPSFMASGALPGNNTLAPDYR